MSSTRPPGLFGCECGLASCPKCLDGWRDQFRQHMAEFLSGFDTVTMMTVVLTQPSLRQPNLAAIDPAAVFDNIRTIFARTGLGHIPMIGILEVDWNEPGKCWEPHVHCFVAGEYPKTRKLRSWLRSRDPYKGKPPKGVYRPVQRDLLKTEQDVADAIAYATKLTIMRKRVFYRRKKNSTLKVSLRGTQLRDAQRWLARPPRDFVYLQKVRLGSTGFRLLSRKPPKKSI